MELQLQELHKTLACDEDHEKVFPDVPTINFKNKITFHIWSELVYQILMKKADVKYVVEKSNLSYYTVI